MINISAIKNKINLEVLNYFSLESSKETIVIENTKKDFEGDLTIVVFSLLKYSKKSPDETAQNLGTHLLKSVDFFKNYNVVGGFLNLSFKSNYWLKLFNSWIEEKTMALIKIQQESFIWWNTFPNTNKPLHLGHLRNIFLGDSVVSLLRAVGHQVVKHRL